MRNGTSSYSFDQIGNRARVNVPEDPNPHTYVANARNQYTSITGGTASSPSYDDDGNMTSDGAGNTHTWTGENRLEVYTQGDITVETKRGGERSRSNERCPEGWKAKGMAFHQNTYDGQGRRVRKLVKDLGAVTQDLRYMYDGWNLLYEVDMHQVSEPTRRYVWGLDISQSMQGAGGVRGLLFTESNSMSHAVTYDANGNISEYIDLSDGSITAHLEYDAFGRIIAGTGTAPVMFGFSTKYQDEQSGCYYYGFRYYDPEMGGWLNRDPNEERGGVNLYMFLTNNSQSLIDYLGMFWIPPSLEDIFLSSPIPVVYLHKSVYLAYLHRFSSIRDPRLVGQFRSQYRPALAFAAYGYWGDIPTSRWEWGDDIEITEAKATVESFSWTALNLVGRP